MREVIPSTGKMKSPDSTVSTGNTEDTREGPYTGPNKTPPLKSDPEKLTGYLDFCMEQRNETLNQAFERVAVIEDKKVDPESAAVPPFCP